MTPAISLSPRYDLFKFSFPKDWFPQEILDKYSKKMSQNQSVLFDPVSYLNESIKGVYIPGVTDLNMQQQQVSHNRTKGGAAGLGHIRIEPTHENSYLSAENMLSKIDQRFTVTFRRNQGLFNYFMMYETIMWKYDKRNDIRNRNDIFTIDILDEAGCVTSRISLLQPLPSGIDGLEFSYDKVERQADDFTVEFSFNDIDFDFLPFEPVEHPQNYF